MDLFSICITTYNRKERLFRLLKHISENNVNKIKIIVLDDASDDGTEEMVRQFLCDYMIYFRSPVNRGIDGNGFRLMEIGEAYSEYSWWLGDDDWPEADAFTDIPRLLVKHQPDMFVVNQRQYSTGSIHNDYGHDIVETDIVKAYETCFYSGFAYGAYIIRNQLLDIEKTTKYYGTANMIAYAMWESLYHKSRMKNGIKVFITDKVYCIQGIGNKSWRHIYNDVLIGHARITALLPMRELRELQLRMISEGISMGLYGSYGDVVWREQAEMMMVLRGEDVGEKPLPIEEYIVKHRVFDLPEYGERAFAIFGAGKLGKKICQLFSSAGASSLIRYIVDNDDDKHGESLGDYTILPPSVLSNISEKPRVIIAVGKVLANEEVKEQLREMGYKFKEDFISARNFQIELLQHGSIGTKRLGQ